MAFFSSRSLEYFGNRFGIINGRFELCLYTWVTSVFLLSEIFFRH